MKAENDLHGVMAGFDSQEAVLRAAQRAYAAGYREMDAYSPFAVEGLAASLGHKRSKKIPFIFLTGGILGAFVAYFLQGYSMAMAWPLDIGGKPLNSWPMYIPITFELTVLSSATFGVLGMLALNGLPQPYHPVFNVPEFRRASRDRFFLCIEASDPRFDPAATWEFLEGLNPCHLSRVPK
jgi:Alternative complex III, ActD subunit